MFRRSGIGVRHIDKVKLRRARLVLGLVTTFSGSTILVYIQSNLAWPSLSGCNEYKRWFRLRWGWNCESCPP